MRRLSKNEWKNARKIHCFLLCRNKKTLNIRCKNKRKKKNAKFDSYPGLVFSLRNSKVAYFHVSWTEKARDWFRCKWEKEYIFLLLFSLAFSTLLLKYLMLIRSFYQDPVLLFCYIWSLLTYLYWFHCLTEEYQDRLTPSVSAGRTEYDVLSAMGIISTVICHEM